MNVIVELSDGDLRAVVEGGAVTGGGITVVLAGSDTAGAVLDADQYHGVLVLDESELGLIRNGMVGRLPLADGTRVDVQRNHR